MREPVHPNRLLRTWHWIKNIFSTKTTVEHRPSFELERHPVDWRRTQVDRHGHKSDRLLILDDEFGVYRDRRTHDVCLIDAEGRRHPRPTLEEGHFLVAYVRSKNFGNFGIFRHPDKEEILILEGNAQHKAKKTVLQLAEGETKIFFLKSVTIGSGKTIDVGIDVEGNLMVSPHGKNKYFDATEEMIKRGEYDMNLPEIRD